MSLDNMIIYILLFGIIGMILYPYINKTFNIEDFDNNLNLNINNPYNNIPYSNNPYNNIPYSNNPYYNNPRVIVPIYSPWRMYYPYNTVYPNGSFYPNRYNSFYPFNSQYNIYQNWSI